MKQTLSEFISIKRTFFEKHSDGIGSKIRDKSGFIQEVFDILQHMDPANEREVAAYEYLTSLVLTTNRVKKYKHPLGKFHMYTDIIMNHLEVSKKARSQIALEEREKAVAKFERPIQNTFKRLFQLNAAGLGIYDATKEYPPFIQKLVLLSYIVSQPSLSDGHRLINIYDMNPEPTKYQQRMVQLSLEKVIKNSLFTGAYDQLLSELYTNHAAQKDKLISEEKIRSSFQSFIKSYTDPAAIFTQTRQIHQDRINRLQRNKKMDHHTHEEIFFHAWLFYCSHMINTDLIRESFLLYRDQVAQSPQEKQKTTSKHIANEAAETLGLVTRNVTQEQTIVIEEIAQRIIHTYACFQDYGRIRKYLCRIVSNKGIIVSQGLSNKLQEMGISCRTQTIDHFLKTIQKTADQNGIKINISTPQRKLTGIVSEQIHEVLQDNSRGEQTASYKSVQTVNEVIALLHTFGIHISQGGKIDNLIQQHIINKHNHKKLGVILHLWSQLQSNGISAAQIRVISLKKNKYKTIAFHDGTRVIIRENTVLDICDHDDYEIKRIPKFQQ
ncbi:MAG: hypothetical protein WC004_00065 [Candidatus Absconditabacterales bacterium]